MSDSTVGAGSNTFRVNLRDLWSRVLFKKPLTAHYLLSSTTADQIAGLGTLQRFPKYSFLGRDSVPLHLHNYAYPLSRGGQYALFQSRVIWFDLETLGWVAASEYVHNRGVCFSREEITALAPDWGWQCTDSPRSLELPRESVTVNFDSTDPVYVSAEQPLVDYECLGGWGIGQSTAYARGGRIDRGLTTTMRLRVQPLGRPGVLAFIWTETHCAEGVDPLVTDTRFTVNTLQDSIESASMACSVVSVDDANLHTWRSPELQWRRVS